MPVNITVRIILIPLLAFGLARIGALLIHASSEDVYRKDFLADYLSARALLAGIDAYENLPEIATRVGVDPVPSHLPHPNPHPPTAILVSAPFALVEFESAALLWLVSEIVLLFAAFCVLLRTLGVRRWLLLSALMTVAVACWPVVFYELAFGQWMTLILLLMTLSWRYLRSKNDVLGGSLLGSCMAI